MIGSGIKGVLFDFDGTLTRPGAMDFTAIITRDDSLPKPHPEGVFQAAFRMGITASEFMLVGDFRFDIMAGKAARACSVLLGNGRGSVMAPGDPEPDYTVDNLLQVIDILEDR